MYAFGQGSSKQEIDQEYQHLKAVFNAGNYEETLSGIDGFRLKYSNSERESSITLLAAQAALKLRNLNRARNEARYLILKFPDSGYIDDSRWILAECDLMSERWTLAEQHLDWILAFSQDPDLSEAARIRMNALRSFINLKKYDSVAKRSSPVAKIGLILPLTGESSEKARDYLHGFQTAWGSEPDSNLIVYDSKNDPIHAVRLAQQLNREDGVWGIVGGLDPAESAALASISEVEKIAFLTTECGVEGLAGIGRHVFQGRADFRKIGEALARHAVLDLDRGRFGILAPVSQEGQQIIEGFKTVLDRLGGEVVAEEIYYPGAEDFKPQLDNIRRKGLHRLYDDSLRLCYEINGYLMIDSAVFDPPEADLVPNIPRDLSLDEGEDTTWTVSDELLDSLWKADHKRLLEWMEDTGEEIDSLEIPLDVFGGFLLVIERDKVKIVAPQFARANLRTQLLGNELWDDLEKLRDENRYVEGMIFAVPLAVSGGEDYYEFATSIAGEENIPVNHFHLAGERAARMIRFAVERSTNSDSFRRALSQIRDLETLSGKVTLLKEERVDRHVTLRRFVNNELETIEP